MTKQRYKKKNIDDEVDGKIPIVIKEKKNESTKEILMDEIEKYTAIRDLLIWNLTEIEHEYEQKREKISNMLNETHKYLKHLQKNFSLICKKQIRKKIQITSLP